MPLAQRDELRMRLFQAPRLLDVGDRNHPPGAVCERIAGERKGTEHVNHDRNAARCACAGFEVEDLYVRPPTRHVSAPQRARAYLLLPCASARACRAREPRHWS